MDSSMKLHCLFVSNCCASFSSLLTNVFSFIIIKFCLVIYVMFTILMKLRTKKM